MACEQENGGPRKTEEEGGGNFQVALFGDFQKKKKKTGRHFVEAQKSIR